LSLRNRVVADGAVCAGFALGTVTKSPLAPHAGRSTGFENCDCSLIRSAAEMSRDAYHGWGGVFLVTTKYGDGNRDKRFDA